RAPSGERAWKFLPAGTGRLGRASQSELLDRSLADALFGRGARPRRSRLSAVRRRVIASGIPSMCKRPPSSVAVLLLVLAGGVAEAQVALQVQRASPNDFPPAQGNAASGYTGSGLVQTADLPDVAIADSSLTGGVIKIAFASAATNLVAGDT